jgi:hypothetical protein
MLTLESALAVKGLTGREITDFMLDPQDDRYQAWWPGQHLAFHRTKEVPGAGHVGDRVLMDEYVGSRRIRLAGEVVQANPGERIVWQMHLWRLRLPVRLTLALQTHGGDVHVRHTVTAGWTGRGRALDPLWRLYFSPSFADSMDRHVRTEFPLLSDLLHRDRREATAAAASVGDSLDGVLL